jgi:hypothetical protein
VTDSASGRGIGDILLELGFASQEDLASAALAQERTGQPLGQILVQNGVITRLELASALAEQWSDPAASISLMPIPTPGARVAPQPVDDAQYAARLEDAVADLARRMQVSEPEDGFNERVTDLAERIEATVAWTQRIEVTVATLAQGLEGVTGGVEEAFATLQSGMTGLAADLARIDTTVAELIARPVEVPSSDPLLGAQLEELRAWVQSLAERPVADDAVRGRVDQLASRLETLVDGAALDDLRGALRELEGRPSGDPELEARLDRVEALAAEGAARAELEAQAALLTDLRSTLADLEARPVGSPETDEKLERIEAHLAERLGTLADTAAVEALAARIDAASGLEEGLVAAVDALAARIDEIAAQNEPDDELTARIDGVEALVETGTAALAELRNGIATLAESAVAGRLEELNTALAALGTEVASLAHATPIDRVEELTATVEELTASQAAQATLTARIEAVETVLTPDLDAVRGRVDQLASRLETLVDGAALDAKVAALEGRLGDDLVTGEALARAIDGIRSEVASAPVPTPAGSPETEPAITQLVERVGALESLAARVDGLTETVAGRPSPASGPRDEPTGFETELERILLAIERLGLQLGEHDRALAELMRSRGVGRQLDELAARIDQLATAGGEGVGSQAAGPSVPGSAADVRALMRRVEDAEASSKEDREKLMTRLDRMASSIDWRLQRLESGDPA